MAGPPGERHPGPHRWPVMVQNHASSIIYGPKQSVAVPIPANDDEILLPQAANGGFPWFHPASSHFAAAHPDCPVGPSPNVGLHQDVPGLGQ